MYNSVLNTDSFDRRRFGQMYDMSEKMKSIGREGRETFPSFLSLMGDMWAGLFKMRPALQEEVAPELQMNRQLMERVMGEASYQEFREFTRLDDLSSALGTMKYSETVLEWIKDEMNQNQDLSDAINQMMNGDSSAFGQAAEAMQQALDQHGSALANALKQAGLDAKQTKENVKSLLGGIGAGKEEAELKKVPLRDQLKLAEMLSSDWKLKQIAEWAGRLKLIAQKKQRSRHSESIDRSGITQGNEVEKLLPSELAAYSSPATKHDFLRRFVEGQTLQYDTKGKEQVGKGPIVLCMDQSGSMDGENDMASKGFALALMSIARKQRRDFALILFSNHATGPLVFERGKIEVKDMVQLVETFLGGGTNFIPPLQMAAGVIGKNRFKKADIVFVTDGDPNDGSSVERFSKSYFETLKKEKNFRVLSLLIGSVNERWVSSFSDKIVKASDFQDSAVHTAFEI